MKNLKKTSGVVRLNDTVGVTKKCSEDWKVSRIQNRVTDYVPEGSWYCAELASCTECVKITSSTHKTLQMLSY